MLNDGRFQLKVVPMSHNRKVGSMAATYRPVGVTCPQDCDLLQKLCYAKKGPASIHQRKSATDYHEMNRVFEKDADMVRHHVGGDFFINDELDTDYLDYIISWHRANPRVHGYTYTHRILDLINAGYTADTLPTNLSIMASLNENQWGDDAIRARVEAAGYRYTRVTMTRQDALTSKRRGEVVCPHQLQEPRTNRRITCKTCKLCVFAKTNVIFIKH